jgi:hypothetical protein
VRSIGEPAHSALPTCALSPSPSPSLWIHLVPGRAACKYAFRARGCAQVRFRVQRRAAAREADLRQVARGALRCIGGGSVAVLPRLPRRRRLADVLTKARAGDHARSPSRAAAAPCPPPMKGAAQLGAARRVGRSGGGVGGGGGGVGMGVHGMRERTSRAGGRAGGGGQNKWKCCSGAYRWKGSAAVHTVL